MRLVVRDVFVVKYINNVDIGQDRLSVIGLLALNEKDHEAVYAAVIELEKEI